MSTKVKPLQASIRGEGLPNLRKALKECLPFKTRGSFQGGYPAESYFSPDPGRLNLEEREKLREDFRSKGIFYMVWSYQTPIAWVCRDGSVYCVKQKFSVTTSRAQSYLSLLATELSI